MNVRMWNHPATKENIIKLKQFGFELIGPNSGEMACGEFGLGRMAEPIEIKNQILSSLENKNLSNKIILITILIQSSFGPKLYRLSHRGGPKT